MPLTCNDFQLGCNAVRTIADKDEICVIQNGVELGSLTSDSGGGTFLSIKHYHLHNPSGTVAPPVFVDDPTRFLSSRQVQMSTERHIYVAAALAIPTPRSIDGMGYSLLHHSLMMCAIV